MKPAKIFLWVALLVCSGEARAQQSDQEKSGNRERGRSGTLGQHVTRRTASEGGDLGADNLDRVAATAGQILEILNSDAGLMVEFKRMMAEDASAGGQILEEADFSENALGERLREDLRTRALATRLLQRYASSGAAILLESGISNENVIDPNRSLHDEFLRSFYEWGVPGLAFLLLFTGALLRLGWQVAREDRSKEGFAFLAIAAALLFSLLIENILSDSSSPGGIGYNLVISSMVAAYCRSAASGRTADGQRVPAPPAFLNEHQRQRTS